MSSESHGVLTKITSCAIHAFLFLWPEIFSWFPFQIVLWTFYQYEVIVTQYIRLVIQAIQSSVCKAEAPNNGFQKMGDQKIESLCISWWSLLLVVFLFGWLLFLFYWSKASSSATPVSNSILRAKAPLIPLPFLSPLTVCGPHFRKALRGSFTYLCEFPARSRSLPTTRRFAGTHHRLVQPSPLHISIKKLVNSQPHATFSIGFLSPVAEICNSRKERQLFLWIRKHWENLCIELAIFFIYFTINLIIESKQSKYEIWNRISFLCHMRLDFTFSPFFCPVQYLFSKVFVSV